MPNDPTQERVRELLHYDPDTGVFTWLVDRENKKAGDVAGKNDNGYIKIYFDRKSHGANRLAFIYMKGQITKTWIDHKDGDPLNNRWNNLREVEPWQNRANSRVRSDCRSGKKGATLLKNGRYHSQITIKRKVTYLGVFDTADEAHQAYLTASNDAFGEFARAG